MRILNIYIPKDQAFQIVPGSGVVGSVVIPDSGTMVVDFEGNVFGSPAMASYEQKIMQAAHRHVEKYPTKCRWMLKEEEVPNHLEFIGVIDYDRLFENLRARRHGKDNYRPDEICVREAWSLESGALEKIREWTPRSQ